MLKKEKKPVILIGDTGESEKVDTLGKAVILFCCVVSVVLVFHGVLVYVHM